MKRYLLFLNETYYPGGGWEDFVGDHDTIEDAIAAAKQCLVEGQDAKCIRNWWHVVDTATKTIAAHHRKD